VKRLSRRVAGALRIVGPGVAVAATGVGAGDLIGATAAGAKFGTLLLWVAVAGAILKYFLTEGLGRWQVVTGTSLLDGWAAHLHPAVRFLFIVYFVLWSGIVTAALLAACGVAAHALLPALPASWWGVVHGLLALGLVWSGRYRAFENVMKALVGVMFLCVAGSALGVWPGTGQVLRGFLPSIPAGSGVLILAVLGGVGGTVTLLSYGYWVEERRWKGAEGVRRLRIDCAAGYVLTGVFGVAMIVLAAGTVHGGGLEVTTRTRAAEVLAALGESIGQGPLLALFLVGFWAAVFSSLVGVVQGVPYLFADFLYTGRIGEGAEEGAPSSYTDLASYRLYQAGMLQAGGLLLFTGRPAVLMMVYALFGSLFMPFLGVTLLWMGNLRGPMGEFRNGPASNLVLGAGVLFFALLFVRTCLAQFV